MPAERLSMRKVREVLRLRHVCGASERMIARSVGVGRSTVAEYLRRAAVLGITWPVPAELDDAALERRLFAPAGFHAGADAAMPDWPRPRRAAPPRRDAGAAVGGVPGRARRRLRLQPVLRPLRRWRRGDQRVDAPDPWRRREALRRLRRRHGAGIRRGDRRGAARRTSSSPCSAPRTTPTPRPRWTRGLADWIGAHVRAFAFFGGVPQLLVPRQPQGRGHGALPLRAGINRTYQELADHYGTAVLPARPRKPRDKAKVEVARADGRALDPGPAAQPALLLAASSTRRSASCSSDLNDRPMRSSASAGASSSRRSSGRRCGRCRPSPTTTPSGRRCRVAHRLPRRGRTTTTTRCRTA